MGIVFRQSVKATLVTFTGAALGTLVNIGYAHLFANFVNGKQLNGGLRNIFVQGNILQLFLVFGTAGVLFTYINRYRDIEKRKLLLSYAAIVPLFVTGIFLIPYLFFKRSIVHLNDAADQAFVERYYLLVPLLALLWAYITQIETFLISQHKTALSAFPREVVLKVVNLILIGLLYFHFISVGHFIILSILVYALPTLMLLPVSIRTGAFGFTFNWRAFNATEYKELSHFGWYHLLGGLTFVLLGQIDTYMLGLYSPRGLKAVSEYIYPVLVVTIMVIPYRSIINAAWPTINAAYSDSDAYKLKSLFRRSSTNIHIISLLMATVIGCNLDNAIHLLPKGYENLKSLVMIMMIGRIVDMATGLNTEVISISKYYKFNFRISVILLVLLIVFNTLLIPQFDVYGAAWSTTISLIIFNVCKMWFLWSKMKIQPFSTSTLLILFAGLMAALAGYYLPVNHNPLIDAMLRTSVIICIYAAMLLWLKPSEDLSAYLKSVWENKRLF